MTELPRPQGSPSGSETSGTEVSAGPENPARIKFFRAAAPVGIEVYDPFAKKPVTVLAEVVNSDEELGERVLMDVRKRIMKNVKGTGTGYINYGATNVSIQVFSPSARLYIGGVFEESGFQDMPTLRIYGGVGVKNEPPK